MKNNNHKNHDETSVHAVHAISSTKKGLLWSLILTGAFFVIELIVGLSINSVAVVADAAHNFSAAAGVGIALLATIFALKPPTKDRTFGFLRAEMLAAFINGILLLGMAYLIFRMGIKNLQSPMELATTPMLILAIIGLIVGGIPAIMLYKKQKHDINVRGAFWHVMETLFGSAAVLIAALIIRFTGWVQADAILGMLLAPVLIIAAWGILKESTRTILDLTPKDVNLAQIKRHIEKIKGVINAHHIHAWTIITGKNVFSAHVKVSSKSNNQKILDEINKMLKEKHNVYFSTVQLEEKCYDSASKEIDFS